MITIVNSRLPIDAKLVICYHEGMNDEMTHQLLKITPEQKDALRQIALGFGFTIGRGREKNWGSINQLAAAIADGELIVISAGVSAAPHADNGGAA